MELVQNLNWLIEQYIRNAEILEEDIKKEQSTFNTYRQAKLGVYKAVIEDLQKILEGEGEWLGRRENRLLDEIRAKIERERSFQRAMDEYDIATGLRKALEIIDKYREER